MDKFRLFEQFQCYGKHPDQDEAETVLTLPGAIGEGYRREIPGTRVKALFGTLYIKRTALCPGGS